MKPYLVAPFLLFASGCFQPGGGSTEHIPPAYIAANQPTELTIRFNVWGSGSGRLDTRYTQVACIYAINGANEQTLAKSETLFVDDKHMTLRFTIPPLNLKPEDSVSYHFKMRFDGHENINPTQILKQRNESDK